MKYTKIMSALALAGCISLGASQVDAAKDALWLPATGNETNLNYIQERLTVQAPSAEVQEKVQEYAQWYKTKAARIVDVDKEKNLREYSGQQFANQKFMDYVNVRAHFYEWSHRYDKPGYGKAADQMSYANQKLEAFRKEIERVIPAADYKVDPAYMAAKTDEERAMARQNYNERVRNFEPMSLLAIEEVHMKDVEISEIRTYANEILLFAIQHTIDHPTFEKMERKAKPIE